MRVFKFGGASIKDAKGVKNLERIVKLHNDQPLIVVVSAMGKSTNLLEIICDYSARNKKINEEELNRFMNFHILLAKELFDADMDFNIMEKELLHFLERMM